MIRRSRPLVLALAVLGAIAPATAVSAAPSSQSVTVKVMSYNILWGGDELNLSNGTWCHEGQACQEETFAQTVNVIRTSGADVVGLNEADTHTQEVADALGWYADARMHVVSRFPLVDPAGANGRYTYVEVQPNKMIAVGNVHLPSDEYGPELVRDGYALADILEAENRLRVPALRPYVDALTPVANTGMPSFLVGDYNSPSHLDWTAAMVGVRPAVRESIDWPVTRPMADAGFSDSYRAVHPNPATRFGLTWTAGYPGMPSNETHDRIDYVQSRNATAVSSKIVGESPANADIVVSPWPSDHRAVLSTFTVTPKALPTTVSVGVRNPAIGDALAVRHHGTGRTGEKVVLVMAGQAITQALVSKSTAGKVDGTLSFSTSGLGSGAHEAVLVGSDGREKSRTQFWTHAPGAPSTVTVGKTSYAIGEPISFTFTNTPGMKFDWVGVFHQGSTNNFAYQAYVYSGAAIDGAGTIDTGDYGFPLGAGTYELRFLLDDAYDSVAASQTFTIG